MTTLDPHAPATVAALEFCGSRITAPEHVGAPIIVATVDDGVVVWPPLLVELGMPIIRLTVEPLGVRVASMRCGGASVFADVHFRYPLDPAGRPCLSGWAGALWCEQVDTYLTAAVALLPVAGHALAAP